MKKPDPRVEAGAEALWKDRAKDIPEWRRLKWFQFASDKPDLAGLFRYNARIMLAATDKVVTP